mmetsp:Transcript_98079/g.194171  ORF Transcript_98079/g.194171 Transcript_98079/m.194171 type:complete len:687 (-) Transcript_98079:177-2237(-)
MEASTTATSSPTAPTSSLPFKAPPTAPPLQAADQPPTKRARADPEDGCSSAANAADGASDSSVRHPSNGANQLPKPLPKPLTRASGSGEEGAVPKPPPVKQPLQQQQQQQPQQQPPAKQPPHGGLGRELPQGLGHALSSCGTQPTTAPLATDSFVGLSGPSGSAATFPPGLNSGNGLPLQPPLPSTLQQLSSFPSAGGLVASPKLGATPGQFSGGWAFPPAMPLSTGPPVVDGSLQGLLSSPPAKYTPALGTAGTPSPKIQSSFCSGAADMGGIQSKSSMPKQASSFAKGAGAGVAVPGPMEQLQRLQEEQRLLVEQEQRRKLEEEQARFLKEQEELAERRRQDAEASAITLHAELTPLVEAVEARVSAAKEIAAALEGENGRRKSDEEVIRIAEEFEVHGNAGKVAVKACADFMAGKYLRLQGTSENTRQGAAQVLKRFREAEREADLIINRVRVRKRDAVLSRDKELKRLAAQMAVEKQESLFKKYDADGDGFLSAREVGEFVKGECNFDLPQEQVAKILESDVFAKSPKGVPREAFSQLRLLVGVAAVTGALSGMEAEVAKAEEKAKPLSQTRGRNPFPPETLEERTDEVDSAVDAARDYLAAAREQVQLLDGDQASLNGLGVTQAVRSAALEARKLGTRLDWFEQRLGRAAAASKASRDRLLLQRKKEVLLRQADLAARGAM